MAETAPERILVIEDDVTMSRMLQALLECAGYAVRTARSGIMGLSGAMLESPNLVMLDVRLPDIDGYEVCRKLRQQSNPWTLPILMLTGLDKPVDQLRGFAFVADAYLTKPCDPDEILRTVALLLGHPEPEHSEMA